MLLCEKYKALFIDLLFSFLGHKAKSERSGEEGGAEGGAGSKVCIRCVHCVLQNR